MKDDLTIEISGMTSTGEGVGTIDGLKVFVDGALPGEKVRLRLTEKKKTYAKGKVLEILEPSSDRTSPICPVADRCGGCQIMHLSYEAQLRIKREKVADAFSRIGKLDVRPLPCLSSPNELGYRNKIQLPVVNGEMGLYAKRSHDIVTFDHCFIHCDQGERVFKAVKALLKKFKLPLRFVLIKSSFAKAESLVTFITSQRNPKVFEKAAKELVGKEPSIKGVILNINTHPGNRILGKKFITLEGSETIQETLGSLTFHMSAPSFFQVNPPQALQLYEYALKQAAVSHEDTVIDAYCGVGTLALFFAKAAKKVIGIETVPEAIEDAHKNAALNKITNTEFFCQPAEESLKLLEQGDVVLLNPPRKGCDPQVIQTIIKASPRRVLYISCDPATLARDAALLTEGGFTVDEVQPFDMFPQTMHVETVTTFSRNDFS